MRVVLFCTNVESISTTYTAYWTDFGTAAYSSSFQYRFPFAFQAVFAVLLIIQIIGLPETPRWLVRIYSIPLPFTFLFYFSFYSCSLKLPPRAYLS